MYTIILQASEVTEASKELGPLGVLLVSFVIAGYGFLILQLNKKDAIIKAKDDYNNKMISEYESTLKDIVHVLETIGTDVKDVPRSVKETVKETEAIILAKIHN